MTGDWWHDDDQLLAQLSDAILTGRNVPDRFVELGKGAFSWRNVDAELAELAYDSASASENRSMSTGARAEQASLRALTYAARWLTIEVEVAADALRGQLVPPQQGQIEVRGADGSMVTATADEVGWFVITPVPAASFQLLVRPETGPPVRTGWISL